MWLILIALLAGVALGAWGNIPEQGVRNLDRIMTGTLFLMLAALGAQIGIDSDLLSKLSLLGGRAVVISSLAVTGSVILLWITVRYCKLAPRKGDSA